MKPVCLSIAGSDSCAGAGIQADIKTFASLDCYAATVVTALTAQSTQGVQSVVPVDPVLVSAQLKAVLTDMPIVAVKIGMLANRSIIEVVAKQLAGLNLSVVLDPVLMSSSGAALLENDALEILQSALLPMCNLITPNIQEAKKLTGMDISSPNNLEELNMELMKSGVEASLITGGDTSGQIKTDLLSYTTQEGGISTSSFSHETLNTPNSHGTGCTLSSAITSFLAKGLKLQEAAKAGITYTHKLLKASKNFNTGMGSGALDHFALINTRDCYESFFK